MHAHVPVCKLQTLGADWLPRWVRWLQERRGRLAGLWARAELQELGREGSLLGQGTGGDGSLMGVEEDMEDPGEEDGASLAQKVCVSMRTVLQSYTSLAHKVCVST